MILLNIILLNTLDTLYTRDFFLDVVQKVSIKSENVLQKKIVSEKLPPVDVTTFKGTPKENIYFA